MALVEFTPRAEQSILEILRSTKRLEQTTLVVDIGDGDGEAQLSVHQTTAEWERLQRDIRMVGPFRVTLGGENVAVFVREPETAVQGRYELDFYACGGRKCFQIRPRELAAIAD